MVQLREKTADSRAFYDEALHGTDRVPLIINDRVDIALAVDRLVSSPRPAGQH